VDVGVQLIDCVGRRRLIGAFGVCLCEFIVAIVGVTAGHIDPVTQAVNKAAQQVLIVFVRLCACVLVHLFFFFFFFFDTFTCFLRISIDISLSSLSLEDLLYG